MNFRKASILKKQLPWYGRFESGIRQKTVIIADSIGLKYTRQTQEKTEVEKKRGVLISRTEWMEEFDDDKIAPISFMLTTYIGLSFTLYAVVYKEVYRNLYQLHKNGA